MRKPDYEAPGVKLYLGDCLEVLPELSGVDAVVTDPPYGVGFKYASHNDTSKGYGEFIWRCISLAENASRPGAFIGVWQAAKNVRFFSDWFPRQWKLLVAAKSFAQILPGPTWPAYEPIVCWWKDGGTPEAFGKCRRDFMVADTNPSTKRRRGDIVEGHPCPRPLSHVEWVVSTWCPPSAGVLDPFMGSGTTGVACIRTGRNFVGIEIEPRYFDIAVKRIEAELARQPLLAGGAA